MEANLLTDILWQSLAAWHTDGLSFSLFAFPFVPFHLWPIYLRANWLRNIFFSLFVSNPVFFGPPH
jgi:hypothetical protein